MEIPLNTIEHTIKNFGSPIYMYDELGIRNRAKTFMETFRKYIPNFKQYFAVKATPNKYILDILEQEGMGFDCSSITEVDLVNSKPTTEIIYTSNYTSVEDFEKILQHMSNNNTNIIINLDDIDGLDNLIVASTNTGIVLPELISFRLNPLFGSTSSETSSNVLGGSNTKFGVPSDKIVKAYELAKTSGFTKFGIHVMTGSCVLDIDYFKELVDVVFENVAKLHNELNITFEFVDLGGGIGINYRPEQVSIDLDLLAKTIAEAVQTNLQKYLLPFNPVIAMENGRYITGPFGFLVSKCKSIKCGVNDVKFYGMDACMANLMRPGMYGAYHKITVPRLAESTEFAEANVVGTLCENNDWFAKNRVLPVGIEKNDIFVIHDAGAHGFSMGFQYNGKTRSAEVLYNKETNQIRVIRNKELHCFF